MDRTILDDSKSHYTSGPFGSKGDDSFDFNIPSGYQYKGEILTILEAHSGGGARIDQKPSVDQTGSGRIRVHWWYNGFGKIRYNINAQANEIPGNTNPPPETIYINSNTISHYTGWPWGSKGDEDVKVTLPEGYSFSSVQLRIVQNTSAGATIIQQPPLGSVGNLVFKVHWWYSGFGKVRCYLEVIAKRIAPYQIQVTGMTWNPNPAKAGNPVTFTVNVKNIGTSRIDNVDVKGTVYAKHLDDVSDLKLGLASDKDRTQNIYNNTLNLNLQPGQSNNFNIQVNIPATFQAMGHTYSTAGTYRLTINIAIHGGISLDTIVIDDFKVIK